MTGISLCYLRGVAGQGLLPLLLTEVLLGADRGHGGAARHDAAAVPAVRSLRCRAGPQGRAPGVVVAAGCSCSSDSSPVSRHSISTLRRAAPGADRLVALLGSALLCSGPLCSVSRLSGLWVPISQTSTQAPGGRPAVWPGGLGRATPGNTRTASQSQSLSPRRTTPSGPRVRRRPRPQHGGVQSNALSDKRTASLATPASNCQCRRTGSRLRAQGGEAVAPFGSAHLAFARALPRSSFVIIFRPAVSHSL